MMQRVCENLGELPRRRTSLVGALETTKTPSISALCAKPCKIQADFCDIGPAGLRIGSQCASTCGVLAGVAPPHWQV